MRIVSVKVDALAAPFPEPLRFAAQPLAVNTAVVAHVEEAGGAVGFGYAPTFGFGTGALCSHLADDFAPRLTGADVERTADALAPLADAAGIAGRVAGTARQALAIAEMALLDLEAQLAGVPLHALWDRPAGAVRAYASGGWRFLDTEALVAFARRRLDDGFGAVKVQVGLGPEEDAARLRALREAIGPDATLMLDANRLIPTDRAREWVAALEPFTPLWLEEPLATDRQAALADLRREVPVPIAAGESETEPGELEALVAHGAVDVVQPDVHRVGLTAASAVAGPAAAAGIVVAPHMAHDVSVHTVSGDPAGWVEYFDWFDGWWETPALPVDGAVAPRAVPGHGLRLRPGFLEAHRV
jgi:L-alanine-DL-glutamate epimerase-like enolase superfamily enzyme